MEEANLSMLCDFYEFTMGNGYLKSGQGQRIAYFDLFYRTVPDGGGFVIAAGLEQVIDYINNLHFDERDIRYFRSKNIFDERFLAYLQNLRFTGDIFAVPEGTCVFPNEPILTVRAPIIEAQLLETFLLMTINHQSLIATKANRIVRAAQGRTVLEFGSRRAQGVQGAVKGARAAYIGGCAGTACTLTDELYGVPAGGTMAHSWVQVFDTEYEAFRTYCEMYPTNAVLLVDTYNVLQSGIPNAIRAFREVLLPRGITDCGIRIDSGDIAYLTKKARKMLDEAGLANCKIVVSNSLDEYLIEDVLTQGACIDTFGVGERMITAKSSAVLDGVYKLVAVEDEGGALQPRIKISEDTGKIINPHYKKAYRFYDHASGKAMADLLCMHDEVIAGNGPYTIFDPEATWKTKTLNDFSVKQLLQPVFQSGKQVYQSPPVGEIRTYCMEQVASLWDEVKRFENPHRYYVDLSRRLWELKTEMCAQASAGKSL